MAMNREKRRSESGATDDLDEKKMQRLPISSEDKYSYTVEFCL